MPEMTFQVRWPDGSEVSCYSPSLVMHDYLDRGAVYSVDEFVSRSSAALDLASERVRKVLPSTEGLKSTVRKHVRLVEDGYSWVASQLRP